MEFLTWYILYWIFAIIIFILDYDFKQEDVLLGHLALLQSCVNLDFINGKVSPKSTLIPLWSVNRVTRGKFEMHWKHYRVLWPFYRNFGYTSKTRRSTSWIIRITGINGERNWARISSGGFPHTNSLKTTGGWKVTNTCEDLRLETLRGAERDKLSISKKLLRRRESER